MAGHAAVGVDDDLAAGQAGVAHRAADLESAGRVDEESVVARVEVDEVEDRVDDVPADVGGQHHVEADVLACCEDTTTVSMRTGRSFSS